jgi:CRISPR-associated protein Csx1
MITTPQKRNFFAHAGFEGNITECRILNGKIYLRYKDNFEKTIKGWLKESV